MNLEYTPINKSEISKKKYEDGVLTGLNKRPIGDKITYMCDWCGISVTKLKCEYSSYENHFCSKSCRAKWIGNKLRNDFGYRDKQRDLSIANNYKPPILIGENHWNWKGGISTKNRGSDQEYKKWRIAVLRKDNYTCVLCGRLGGKLSAHHIKQWSEYPELRYDLNNGQCMCYACHMEFHGLTKK